MHNNETNEYLSTTADGILIKRSKLWVIIVTIVQFLFLSVISRILRSFSLSHFVASLNFERQ